MTRCDSSNDAESELNAEDEGHNPLDDGAGSDSNMEAWWGASGEDEVGDSTDDEPEIGVVSHGLLAAGAANRVASRRLVLVGDSDSVTSPGMEDTQADQESDVGQVDGEDEPVVETHVEFETESVELSEVDEDWAENANIVEDDVVAPVGESSR